MKHNNISLTGNFEKDYAKAIKRFSREVYGFQVSRMTKNKKKYDRNREKVKLQKENSGAYYLCFSI